MTAQGHRGQWDEKPNFLTSRLIPLPQYHLCFPTSQGPWHGFCWGQSKPSLAPVEVELSGLQEQTPDCPEWDLHGHAVIPPESTEPLSVCTGSQCPHTVPGVVGNERVALGGGLQRCL